MFLRFLWITSTLRSVTFIVNRPYIRDRLNVEISINSKNPKVFRKCRSFQNAHVFPCDFIISVYESIGPPEHPLSRETTVLNQGSTAQPSRDYSSQQVRPFTWDKNTTQLLVERYMHLKDAFRDPKIKKRKLWDQIKTTFVQRGHNVTEDILDRKWRNMKKTYTGIKDNIRRTGRGRIHWDYYHQFDEIYRADKTVNFPQTISSAPASVIRTVNPEATNEPGVLELPQPSQPSYSATPQSQKDIPLTPKSKKMESKSGMFYLRKKLATIEEARVEELRLLRQALEEHNEIQEERNTILRELGQLPRNQ